MRNNSRQIDIDGKPQSQERLLGKLAWVALCVAGGAACFSQAGMKDEAEMMWGSAAVVLWLVALFLPSHKHHYIDLQNKQIVHKHWYWSWQKSEERLALDQFSKIVVHLVCHPGGEGEDTFTGSVGLKPKNGKAIVWVKSFPATKEEMPREPDEFARELAEKIGLPYHARRERTRTKLTNDSL